MADVIAVSELSPTFSSSKTDPILYVRPSFQTEPICVMIVGIQLNSMINQNSTECLQQSAKCRTGGTTIQAESGKKVIDKMNYLFMLWFKFILGLKFFELVSILFAIVPDYGNEYTTKENKN